MPTFSPSQLGKLRGLIAKALDQASTEPEAQASAMAACRLLADAGLGVDGDPEAEVTVGRCESCESRATIQPTPTYVVYAAQEAARPAQHGAWSRVKFGQR